MKNKPLLFLIRNYRKPIPFIILIFTFCFLSAQEKSFYFASGKSTLAATQKLQLDSLIKISTPQCNWQLDAITDSVGSVEKNYALAKKRGTAVNDYLVSKGVDQNKISQNWLGEKGASEDKGLNELRNRNRRVDVKLSCVDTDEIKKEILKKFDKKPSVFCIIPAKDTVLKATNGTMVLIRANSLQLPKDFTTDRCLKITITEVFSRAGIILNDLTTTSNGVPMNSDGMINVVAEYDNRPVQLAPGKDMVIFFPTDTILPEMQPWSGQRQGDGNINWSPNNVDFLGGLDFAGKECEEMMKGYYNYCRGFQGCDNDVKRLDSLLEVKSEEYKVNCGGSGRGCFPFRKPKPKTNAKQKAYVEKNNYPDPVTSEDALALDSLIRMDKNLKSIKDSLEIYKKLIDKIKHHPCFAKNEKLDSLFKAWGISNQEELIKALWEKRENAFLNSEKFGKKISPTGMKYYVFTTTEMDWCNIDWLKKYGPSERTDFYVSWPVGPEYEVMLSFDKTRTILSGKKENKKYVFGYIPYNEPFKIIAIRYSENGERLKIQAGVATESSNSISIKDPTDVSHEKFIEELKKLDIIR